MKKFYQTGKYVFKIKYVKMKDVDISNLQEKVAEKVKSEDDIKNKVML